jgi:hypothetical protein
LIQDESGPRVGEALASEHHLGNVFLAALVGRDFPTIEGCFHPEVRFRSLIPPGVREAGTAQDTITYLRRWFADADHHELIDGHATTVGDRLHVAYRFRVHDADGWQVVEQQTYCDVQNGKITRMDLLCSGFRPCDEPA